MNLYKFKEEYNLIILNIKKITNEIIMLRNSLEPGANDIKDEAVQTSVRKDKITDKIATIVQLEKKLKELGNKADNYKSTIEEMEKILKQFNDDDQLIYLEYHLKGYSMIKIATKREIDKSTVSRKIKKIEEKLKNATPCN